MALTQSHTTNFHLSSNSNSEHRAPVHIFPCLSFNCRCISDALEERTIPSVRHRKGQGFVQSHTAT